jgi:hypothetical protein
MVEPVADVIFPDATLPTEITARVRAYVQLNAEGRAVAVALRMPPGLPSAFADSAQEGLLAGDYFGWLSSQASPREGLCASIEFIEEGVRVRIRWDVRIQASHPAPCLDGK